MGESSIEIFATKKTSVRQLNSAHVKWTNLSQVQLLKCHCRRAAQTVVTKGYKSLYHEVGLPFYRKTARCGTVLVVLLS